MQKTKKILSVIVAMLMLFSMMMPMASAAEFTDVAPTHKYYQAISNLSAYGIVNGMGDGTFAPDASVTRAQFTKMICAALNSGELNPPVVTEFTDVDPNHWAAGYIKMAAAREIINGMGDGTFKPEDPVKFEQAVKMIVCALGYGPEASRAGYPVGYINKANELGLLKGLASADNTQGINSTRGAIAKLIDNMLNTEQYTSTGEKGTTIKDKTVKTEDLNGQVVSVYGSTIYADENSDCGRNQIEILAQNGERYFFSISELDSVKANVNDYLGKRVTVYYSSEDDLAAPILTNLIYQAGKNDVTVVDLADIQDYTNTDIEYIEDRESGDTEEISVLSDANILYNGVATDEELEDLIDTKAPGQITFIDSDVDGDADVVFVKVYTTMVVKSKASSTFKVYGENSESIILDEDSASITIKKNGKVSEFKNINVGDVLSYASSAGDKVIDVLVSNTVVSGTVSQLSATQGTVTIRTSSTDKAYKRSSYFDKYSTTALEVGTTGKFYIDAFGKIAKVNASSESTYTYAYLTGFENVGTSTTPSYAVQVIKINGSSSASKVQYSLANKFKIDGESFTDSDTKADIEFALEEGAALFNPEYDSFTPDEDFAQVIKFTTNTSGKIDKIITANYDLDEDNALKVDNMEGAKCTTTGSRIDKQYIINSAKVLILTEDEDGNDKFTGYGASYFKATSSTYNLQFVDMTKEYKVPIILVYGKAGAGGTMWENNAPMVVIDKGISTPEGKDENATYIDVITSTGAEATYFESAEEQGVFDDVEIGDVIRVNVDGEGAVDEIKVVTTLADMVEGKQDAGVSGEGTNKGSTNAEYRQIFGTVTIIGEGSINVATAFVDKDGELDDSEIESFNVGTSTKVIVVDSEKVEQGAKNAIAVEVMEEIIPYDSQPDNASKVLVYTSNSITARMIVVFK